MPNCYDVKITDASGDDTYKVDTKNNHIICDYGSGMDSLTISGLSAKKLFI